MLVEPVQVEVFEIGDIVTVRGVERRVTGWTRGNGYSLYKCDGEQTIYHESELKMVRRAADEIVEGMLF